MGCAIELTWLYLVFYINKCQSERDSPGTYNQPHIVLVLRRREGVAVYLSHVTISSPPIKLSPLNLELVRRPMPSRTTTHFDLAGNRHLRSIPTIIERHHESTSCRLDSPLALKDKEDQSGNSVVEGNLNLLWSRVCYCCSVKVITTWATIIEKPPSSHARLRVSHIYPIEPVQLWQCICTISRLEIVLARALYTSARADILLQQTHRRDYKHQHPLFQELMSNADAL